MARGSLEELEHCKAHPAGLHRKLTKQIAAALGLAVLALAVLLPLWLAG